MILNCQECPYKEVRTECLLGKYSRRIWCHLYSLGVSAGNEQDEILAEKLLVKYMYFYNVCLRPGYVVSIPPSYKISKMTRFYACMKFIVIVRAWWQTPTTQTVDSNNVIFGIC